MLLLSFGGRREREIEIWNSRSFVRCFHHRIVVIISRRDERTTVLLTTTTTRERERERERRREICGFRRARFCRFLLPRITFIIGRRRRRRRNIQKKMPPKKTTTTGGGGGGGGGGGERGQIGGGDANLKQKSPAEFFPRQQRHRRV